jgi:starch phosphorylase
MGKFSSDRSIRDYCRDIWEVQPVKIRLLSEDEVTADLLQ